MSAARLNVANRRQCLLSRICGARERARYDPCMATPRTNLARGFLDEKSRAHRSGLSESFKSMPVGTALVGDPHHWKTACCCLVGQQNRHIYLPDALTLESSHRFQFRDVRDKQRQLINEIGPLGEVHLPTRVARRDKQSWLKRTCIQHALA